MLDITLAELTAAFPRSPFRLGPLSLRVAKGTHTGLIGAAGSGKSLLLRTIAGEVSAQSGEILLGTRAVQRMRASSRPLLWSERDLRLPRIWSVRHVLIAAMRRRSLSREERFRELDAIIARWNLEALSDRRVSSLSKGERARLLLAQLEALRPGIALLERIFTLVPIAERAPTIEKTFRMLRGIGATVISELSDFDEIGTCDQLVVLDKGRIDQSGVPSELYERPRSIAAAVATGAVNQIPITIRNGEVDSAVGSWKTEAAPFEGSGIALARPEWFQPAEAGEESEFIFAIEEAEFSRGRWRARGVLSGGLVLTIELPYGAPVRKGKLLPLRFDHERLTLLPQPAGSTAAATTLAHIPIDVVPPLRDSR